MPYSLRFPSYFVLKGYWVKQLSIPSTDLFMEYLKTIIPWLRSVGGTIIAKDITQDSDLNQWDGGQLGIIVEFESKDAALRAFNSKEFQEYLKFRNLKKNLSLSILD
tara:strand:- start:252 stop:572 length:321 start_codon:yes stop_codon:yes gene_type:complete